MTEQLPYVVTRRVARDHVPIAAFISRAAAIKYARERADIDRVCDYWVLEGGKILWEAK